MKFAGVIGRKTRQMDEYDEPVETDKGIYPKYTVFKYGTFDPVRDFVFVLKPMTDPHARLAMAVYAESVKKDKPKLSEEMKQYLEDME